MKRFLLPTLVMSLALPALAQTAVEATEPTETQGVSVEVLQQNPLAAQIPAFTGYDVRARRITFAAGASFTRHDHAERPGFVFVESGTIVEARGDKALAYSAGSSWIEDAETEHWLLNVSDQDAVIIMVDLPPSE